MQMDCYHALDVTEKAQSLAQPLTEDEVQAAKWIRRPVPKREIEKIRVHGWDSLSLDRTEIDLRYLEQVVDESQTAALGYTLQYHSDPPCRRQKEGGSAGDGSGGEDTEGRDSFCHAENYGARPSAEVRVQEILAALGRYRML